MRNRRTPARAGYTLMEMLVVMSVLAVITTISAVLFTSLSRAELQAARSVTAQQTLSRLQERFRRDVHQAAVAEVTTAEDQQPILKLTHSGEMIIRYQLERGDLQRTAQGPETTHRETYRLPETRWSFSMSPGFPERVRLTMHRRADTLQPTTTPAPAVQDWQLEAVLSLAGVPGPSDGRTP